MSVLLETSFGDIVIDLFTEKAPNACTNFLKLCKIKHYNNSLFHEVQKSKDIPIQTMSPKSGRATPPLSGKQLEGMKTTSKIK